MGLWKSPAAWLVSVLMAKAQATLPVNALELQGSDL